MEHGHDGGPFEKLSSQRKAGPFLGPASLTTC